MWRTTPETTQECASYAKASGIAQEVAITLGIPFDEYIRNGSGCAPFIAEMRIEATKWAPKAREILMAMCRDVLTANPADADVLADCAAIYHTHLMWSGQAHPEKSLTARRKAAWESALMSYPRCSAARPIMVIVDERLNKAASIQACDGFVVAS